MSTTLTVSRTQTLEEFFQEKKPLTPELQISELLPWDHIGSIARGFSTRDAQEVQEAAHQHRCWTVTQDRHCTGYEGLRIEAGRNNQDSMKRGYIITQEPWESIEDTVI